MAKTLEYYRNLKYPIHVEQTEDGWVAWHPDLGRLTMAGVGESPQEAIEELNDFRIEIIEGWLEQGLPVPEPSATTDEFSGKFVVRLPKELHQLLAEKAKRDGSSLNQYVVYLLARNIVLDKDKAEFVPVYPSSKAS